MKRTLLFFLMSIFLVSCATPDISDTVLPAADNGIVLMRINLQNKPHPVYFVFADQANIILSSGTIQVLAVGENFRTIELPPGHYYFRRISFEDSLWFAYLGEEFSFDVVANKAIYIGDFDLSINWQEKTYRLDIVNRGDGARDIYKLKYPMAAQAVPFVTAITKGPSSISYKFNRIVR